MDVKIIAKVGRRLKRFLSRFSDCFNRSESREDLETYVNGQVSGLHNMRLADKVRRLMRRLLVRNLNAFTVSAKSDLMESGRLSLSEKLRQ